MLRKSGAGDLVPDTSCLTDNPPVFQLLAAAMPMLTSVKAARGLPEDARLRVAVIGAGAGTLPAALATVHPQAHVDAVDVDPGEHLPLVPALPHSVMSAVLFFDVVTNCRICAGRKEPY